MAQVIKIGMDVADVRGAATELINTLKQQEQSVEGLFRKMAQTNKEGEVTKQVFEAIASDGSKVEATLRKVAEGWLVVSTRVRAAADAMKIAKDQMAAQQSRDLGNRVDRITSPGSRIDLEPAQLTAVESSMQRIRQVVASGKVEFDRFKQIYDTFAANPKNLMSGLTADEAKIVRSLRSIEKATQDAEKARTTAAQKAQADADKIAQAAKKEADAAKSVADAQQRKIQAAQLIQQSGFDLSKIDPSKVAQVEGALAKVRQLLESGAVSANRFKEILAQVKADPNKLIPNLTQQEQQAAKALRTIQDGMNGVKEKGESTKGMFISLGGVIRLLEAQVLKRIFSTLENEILGSVAAAQKFTLAIAEIQTISQDAQLTTGEWSEKITELSSRFGKSQADVSEGVYQTLSNQVAKGAESFKFMETALKFGQASVSSATDSVNLLSGALRSFQLPASDAERVAAILFKTIELGRVRAKDMADTFGRVGMLARDVGVSLEEVSAVTALLTNRGIKFNDASTLMQNILLKLIRPTDEMKELFKEWGVSTGGAAIATFGFNGVLSKLDQEAAKGTGRLGDLLGQIRAIRGVVGLTGSSFNEFQDYLKKVSNAQEEYAKAQQIVQESPGQRAAKQMTELRNFFEQDFGEPMLKGLLRISEAAGGAVNIFKTLIIGVNTGIAGFVIYRATVFASLPAMATWSGLAAAMGLTSVSTAGAVGTLTASLRTMIAAVPYLAVAALAYEVGNRIFYDKANNLEKVLNKASQLAEQANKAREAVRQSEDRSDDNLRDTSNNKQKELFRDVLQFSTTVVKKAEEAKERAITAYKTISEAIKVTAGNYFQALKDKLKGFTEAATEAKNLIKQSLKEAEGLQGKAGDRIFGDKMKYASSGYQDKNTGMIIGDQQIDLLKNRINMVSDKAREEYSKGTSESISEARRLFNEVEQLQSQLFEKGVTQQRQLFEFQAQHGQIAPIMGADGKARYEFVVRTAEMEQQINKTTEERLGFEERFRQQQKARQEAAEREAAREKERIRALEEQFHLLEKIDIFTKEGKIKDDYKGKGGMEKLLTEFDQRRDRILELSGGDKDQFQVFRDLQQQRNDLIREIRASMQQETAAGVAESATRDMQTSEKLGQNAREKLTQFRNDIEAAVDGLRRQMAKYSENLERPIITTTGLGFETRASRSARWAAEPARQQGLEALRELDAANTKFNADGGRTIENAQAIETAIKKLNTAMLDYIQIHGMNSRESVFKNDARGLTVQDNVNITGDIGGQIVRGAEGVQQSQNQLRGSEELANRVISRFREVPEIAASMQQAMATASRSGSENLGTLTASAMDYANVLEQINRLLDAQAAKTAAIQRAPIPAAEGQMFGGQVKYFNNGGYVGFVPRGSDRIPAMLGADETVMTAAASKQFMPLLKAMNAGTMPRYMNQGGPVTNVGDISINVSGGQTDEQSLRNIAQGLRRGIRRGTISLDK